MQRRCGRSTTRRGRLRQGKGGERQGGLPTTEAFLVEPPLHKQARTHRPHPLPRRTWHLQDVQVPEGEPAIVAPKYEQAAAPQRHCAVVAARLRGPATDLRGVQGGGYASLTLGVTRQLPNPKRGPVRTRGVNHRFVERLRMWRSLSHVRPRTCGGWEGMRGESEGCQSHARKGGVSLRYRVKRCENREAHEGSAENVNAPLQI